MKLLQRALLLLPVLLGGCSVNYLSQPAAPAGTILPVAPQPAVEQPAATPVTTQPVAAWPGMTLPASPAPGVTQPQPVQGTRARLQALTPGWQNPLPPQRYRKRRDGHCEAAGEAAVGTAPLGLDLAALAADEERAITAAGFGSAGSPKSVQRPGSWGANLGLFGLVAELASDLCLEGAGARAAGSGALRLTMVWRLYSRPGPIPLIVRRLPGRARLEGRAQPAAFDRLLRSAMLESLRAFLADPEVRQVVATGRRPDGFSIPPGGPLGDPAPIAAAPPAAPPSAPEPPQAGKPGKPGRPDPGKPPVGRPRPLPHLPALPPFAGSAGERGAVIARAIVGIEGPGGSGQGVVLEERQGLVLTLARLVGEAERVTLRPARGTAVTAEVLRRDPARGLALLAVGRSGPWRALPIAPERPQGGARLLQFLEEGKGERPARFAGLTLRRRLPDGGLLLAGAVPPGGAPLLDPAGNLAALALGSEGGSLGAIEAAAALAGLGLR